MKNLSRRSVIAGAGLAAMAGPALPAAWAAALTPLSIVIFSPPSLGAMLPGVIKKEKFDHANGLDISFPQRTPDAYVAQFDSGEFQLGGSASVLVVGRADTLGVKVAYLFNLFDYFGAVVTQQPDIKTLADLKGKELVAAKGTTNFAMFEWFARRQSLDPSTVRVLNTATPGLLGYALANRADAVELWEPAYTLLLARKPSIRTLDLHIDREWRKFAGSTQIPYLGVAAHRDWIAKHKDLVPPLYRTYKAAADWVVAHPEEAAPLISPNASKADMKALATLISHNERLRMNVAPASELAKEIDAVYRAGQSLGYLKKKPSSASIYGGTIG